MTGKYKCYKRLNILMLMKHSQTENLTDTVKKKNELQMMCSINFTQLVIKE